MLLRVAPFLRVAILAGELAKQRRRVPDQTRPVGNIIATACEVSSEGSSTRREAWCPVDIAGFRAKQQFIPQGGCSRNPSTGK